MTTKSVFILFIYTFFTFRSEAQDSLIADHNALFAEFLGNAQTLISANYERVFQSKKNLNVSYSLGTGIGIQANQFDEHTFFSIPIEACTFIGIKHNIETGIGLTCFFGTSNLNDPQIPIEYRTNFDYSFAFRLGYRLVKNNGLLFRLAPVLLIKKNPPVGNCFKLQPIFGISFGKCF